MYNSPASSGTVPSIAIPGAGPLNGIKGLKRALQVAAIFAGLKITKDVIQSKNGLKSFQVYEKVNPSNGFVYVGRTSGIFTPERNIYIRDRGHHMTGKGYGKATKAFSSYSKAAVRGMEQILIAKYSIPGKSGNSINGISQKNKNIQHYFTRALEEAGSGFRAWYEETF